MAVAGVGTAALNSRDIAVRLSGGGHGRGGATDQLRHAPSTMAEASWGVDTVRRQRIATLNELRVLPGRRNELYLAFSAAVCGLCTWWLGWLPPSD